MNNFKILLVDDDDDSREVLEEFISGILGFYTQCCSNGIDALDAFENDKFDLVISDIRMPAMNGLDLLASVKKLPQGKKCPFVLMTGFAEIETAVAALKLGAVDYLMKPVDVNRLNDIIVAHSQTDGKIDDAELVNNSRRFKYSKGSQIFLPKIGKVGIYSAKFSDAIKKADMFRKDRSISTLIEGESGTGKEIIACLIHGTDNDKQPLITMNCSAIAENLFESELFGYVGGAFSGARSQGLAGKFELAHGGTLFLDEIGDMPMGMQPKLLRALQDREIYRIGGQKSIDIDVRIIAATNRNLKKLVAEGKFREDLYHRLNLGYIQIAPLREQKEAILPLAQMMLEDCAQKRKKSFKYISDAAAEILMAYQWSGNVRELANIIDRVVLLYDSNELSARHLSMLDENYLLSANNFVLTPESDFALPEEFLDLEQLEKEIVRRALIKFDGNKTRTADYLKISRSALRSRTD